MTGIDCIAALKALGELNRMRIVRLLLKEQLGVNQISERLKMSQYNVSKHLRILREAGLVEMEKEGQQRPYAVGPAPEEPTFCQQEPAGTGLLHVPVRQVAEVGSRQVREVGCSWNWVALAGIHMHICAYAL
jgi:DNA-binding transcriptional ArsR family regulator